MHRERLTRAWHVSPVSYAGRSRSHGALVIDLSLVRPSSEGTWFCSSVGRALRLHRRCRRFEPCRSYVGAPVQSGSSRTRHALHPSKVTLLVVVGRDAGRDLSGARGMPLRHTVSIRQAGRPERNRRTWRCVTRGFEPRQRPAFDASTFRRMAAIILSVGDSETHRARRVHQHGTECTGGVCFG